MSRFQQRWIRGLAVGAAAVFALYLVARPRYSYGGAPLRPGIDRDPENLLPGFALKLELLFRAMRARGYRPLLWEGYRTPERAEHLDEVGTGISKSLHILGAAVDIVDEASAPAYWAGSGGFYVALGEEAERLGLTWGGRFSDPDPGHVQAVSYGEQAKLWAMSPAERAAYVV